MIYVVTRYCRIGNDCVVTFLLFSSETITTANIYLIEQSIRKESQITKIMTTQICSDIENNEIFRENIFYFMVIHVIEFTIFQNLCPLGSVSWAPSHR